MFKDRVVRYALMLNPKINILVAKTFLESSPYYPSWLSAYSMFRFIGLDIIAGKCEIRQLERLSLPYMLHLSINGIPTSVIAKNGNNGKFYIYSLSEDRWIRKDKSELNEVWDGHIFYSLHSSQKNIEMYALMAIITAVIVFLSILHIFLLPCLCGLFASLLYSIRLYGNSTPMDSMCSITTKTNCNKLATSIYGDLFGYIRVVDLAIAFFLAQLMDYAIFEEHTLGVIASILFPSTVLFLPVLLFSVFSQIKIGYICPVCIIILCCLFAQALQGVYFFHNGIQVHILVHWLSIYTLVFITFMEFRLFKKETLKEKEINLDRLTLIRKDVRNTIKHKKENTINKVTIFLSPSCIHCKKALKAFLLNKQKQNFDFALEIAVCKVHPNDEKTIEEWKNIFNSYTKEKLMTYMMQWCTNSFERLLNRHLIRNVVNQIPITICYEKEFMIIQRNVVDVPRIAINDIVLNPLVKTDDIGFLLADQ